MKKLLFPLLTVVLIGILGHIVLYIPPDQYTIPAFFIIVFLTIFCIFYMLLRNIHRSGLIGLGVILLLVLAYFGMLNVFTGILVLGFLITMELLMRK